LRKQKQKQNGNQQRRPNVDKRGYVSKKLLAEFPNKAFEVIPTVWKLAFSALVLKDKKYVNTETQFIEILHTVPKGVFENAV